MLEQLVVKNFALIEDLRVDFSEKFNVLTGETGAGKSIIIDALALLLGGRAQAEYIRVGAAKAILEGVFYLPPLHEVNCLLVELGVEIEESLLVLRRELTLNGRNICRINNTVFPLKQYQQIGLALVELHGQHDHQALLQAEQHLSLLDKFGGVPLQELKETVAQKYRRYLFLKKELQKLKDSEKERLQKQDFFNFQWQEIEQAQIKQGEFEELTQEVKVLAHAEKINEHLALAYQQLFAGENGLAAYDLLGKALNNLQQLADLDPLLQEFVVQLEPVLYLLADIAGQIREYQEGITYSPARLAQSEARLYLLKELCQKYGPTIEDVFLYAQKIKKALEEEISSGERKAALLEEVEQVFAEYKKAAELLSKKRKKLAQVLETKVTQELLELAMPHVRFSVDFTVSEPMLQGTDRVEFLISPNLGEPLLPVAKIASGGELSRIMLALKTIMALQDDLGSLIFDEIDAGIGGQAVQKVAEKLAQISQSQQVICVTHSPLIAAIADQHFLLKKKVKKGRTQTLLYLLNKKERTEELVRMLGGEDPSPDLRKYAAEILKK